jgi:hypothetical protein
LTNIKFKRRKKFLASRFRYYPNSDASFNVERNPGPSNGSKSSSITPSKHHESLTSIMQNVRSLKSFQLDNLTNCRENKLIVMFPRYCIVKPIRCHRSHRDLVE